MKSAQRPMWGKSVVSNFLQFSTFLKTFLLIFSRKINHEFSYVLEIQHGASTNQVETIFARITLKGYTIFFFFLAADLSGVNIVDRLLYCTISK